ncbi:MAG: thiamine pyrophosphate-dependent dehydrogenase E1 component subunit alpha [Granulosicoccus sp.]
MNESSSATNTRSNTDLEALYRQMRRIRSFEERVGELFVLGESAGSMLHLSIGEESAAVGVASTMEQHDTFTTHHRGHGIFLARDADPNRMMAEIAGKQSGYCGGKGGSMHIADMSLGHLGANAIVGGGIPAVVGAGLASKLKKSSSVSVAFFGDGAMQQGVLYESMNMAALWDLPVVFVCINNQYGMGTRVDRASKVTEFHPRAEAFGLQARSVNGLDVLDVRAAASDLLDDARGGKPGFLSISCYRFFGHARKDKSPYRSDQEEQEGRQQDPVAHARAQLCGTSSQSDAMDALDQAIEQEMDASLKFAIDAMVPPLASMFKDVYGDEELQPEPLGVRIDRILARG